jgi:serine/threonine protein kinase/tetratricopeptide (TPR) repeat protein
MPSQQDQRAKEIVYNLLEVDTSDRPRLMDDMCNGDADLRAAVEQLLAFDRAANPLDQQLASAPVVEGPPQATPGLEDGQWELVKALYEKLSVQLYAEWSQLLAQSGADPKLRRAVSAVLEMRRQRCEWSADNPARGWMGKLIGRYLVVGGGSRGGYGIVLKAARADGEYQKDAAIKMITAGRDDAERIERFHLERQCLANLKHPHISAMYDSGVLPGGTPYFVMEWIEGSQITDYCDHQRLGVRDRVRLFVQVCEAVQHAHAHFIIHRDLKPGNILVNREGAVKLVDFGIAKELDPPVERGITRDGIMPLTPEYCSPEHIQGGLYAASDVYSLGAVLYRLLTGEPAHQFRSAGDIYHVVCAQRVPPVRQQAARHGIRVPRDLEALLVCCLQKQPDLRYQSVVELQKDLERFVAGKPMRVRGVGPLYRSIRWLTSHKMLTALVLAIVAGTSVAWWQSQATLRQTLKVQQRSDDLRSLATQFTTDLLSMLERVPGSAAAREKMATVAVEYLKKLSAEAGNDPDLQLELAFGYTRVGDIRGRPNFDCGPDPDGAMANYRTALEIAGKLNGSPSMKTAAAPVLAVANERIASILFCRKQYLESLQYFENAVKIFDDLEKMPAGMALTARVDVLWRMILGYSKGTAPSIAIHLARTAMEPRMAGCYCKAKQPAKGIETYRHSVSELDEARRRSPHDLSVAADLGATHAGWSDCVEGTAEGREHARRALELARLITRVLPSDAHYLRALAEAYRGASAELMAEGRRDEAVEHRAEAEVVFQILRKAGETNLPTANEGLESLAGHYENMPRVMQNIQAANALANAGNISEAGYHYAAILAELESYLQTPTETDLIVISIYEVAFNLAQCLETNQRYGAAILNLEKAEHYGIQSRDRAPDADMKARHEKKLAAIRELKAKARGEMDGAGRPGREQ